MLSKLRLTSKKYAKDQSMINDVKHLEKLALTMGFQHEDIILFESLTAYETYEALLYGY